MQGRLPAVWRAAYAAGRGAARRSQGAAPLVHAGGGCGGGDSTLRDFIAAALRLTTGFDVVCLLSRVGSPADFLLLGDAAHFGFVHTASCGAGMLCFWTMI